jgi:hypothetical protein
MSKSKFSIRRDKSQLVDGSSKPINYFLSSRFMTEEILQLNANEVEKADGEKRKTQRKT